MGELAISGGTPVRTAPFPRWPEWDDTERRHLAATLESGHWWATGGAQAAAFEKAFAAFSGVDHCVAVTNGTHAIEVALLGAGVGEGDEVIVTDYTFFASAAAVACINAIPVLVDIDADTLCIDPDAVLSAITPRTRAVIAVHLAGHPADLDRLTDICKRHDLVLIEDCAHAHGSSWKGIPVGGIGDAGTWSFQQSKLMTAGEGGAVTVRRATTAAAVRSYVDCGRRPGQWFYSHFVLGGNCRMTEWQAAVLRAQLDRFVVQNRVRNENALFLNKELTKIPGVMPQRRDPRVTSQGYYCYVVRIDPARFGAPADKVRVALEAEGLPLTMSYPSVHALHAFSATGGLEPRHRVRQGWPEYSQLELPVAKAAAAGTLWLRHSLLMGTSADAACLIEALAKIHRHTNELV